MLRKKSTEELVKPENLSPKGARAYQVIMDLLEEYEMTYTGGCKAFYSPQEWKARGESYGTTSELVVVYDGGDVQHFFSLDSCWGGGSYTLYERMRKALEAEGLYWEECTRWYCAIHTL